MCNLSKASWVIKSSQARLSWLAPLWHPEALLGIPTESKKQEGSTWYHLMVFVITRPSDVGPDVLLSSIYYLEHDI